MRTHSVTRHFLSLLDVTLILLGVLMLALAHAQVSSGQPSKTTPGPPTIAEAVNASVEFGYLLAGTEGVQNGRCWYIRKDGTVGQEVSLKTDEDIRTLFGGKSSETEQVVVMLLFKQGAWDAAWTDEKLQSMAEVWNVEVVPVYNIPLNTTETEHD